jgi:integrase
MAKQITQNYTLPQVKAKGEQWYVWFRYFNEGTNNWQLVIKKGGVNYTGLPVRERLAQLNALKKAIQFKLEHQGWNPINNSYAWKSLEEQEISNLTNMTFDQALTFSFNKKSKDWSHKTKQDYSSVLKYLLEAAAAIGITYSMIAEVKRPHYKFLLDKVREIRSLSAKGYNKYRDYLSSLLGELEQYDIIEYNPVHKIKSKDTIKVVAHRPPTKDQQSLIINRVKTAHPDYYRFLAVLYGCTIRPKEITALKIKHLHRKEQIFRMVPDNKSSTKGRIEKESTIPDWVMELLSEMNLHNYNPEWYIFSTNNKHGSFLPGPNRMHSNTPTNTWRCIVKKDVKFGGLGLDVNQYSLKKLAGNDMVKMQRNEQATNLLELPRMQMGHTTTKQTEVYVTEDKEVLQDLIKRKMPVL